MTSFYKYSSKNETIYQENNLICFRYDWDNFFIENKEMNEMKPGNKIWITDIPVTKLKQLSLANWVWFPLK